MKITLNSKITPTFGLIELKSADRKTSEDLISEIVKHSTINEERNKSAIKLYKLFEPYIEQEGQHLARKRYPLEDVISDIKIRFWEFMYSISPKNTIDDLISQINNFKRHTLYMKPYSEGRNLDETIRGSQKYKYIDRITYDELPKSQSAIELEKIKKKLSASIKLTEMTKKTKKRIKQRSKGLSYQKIADSEKVSKRTVENSLKQGILKIQHQNMSISKENNRKIFNLMQALNISFDEALNLALRHVELLSYVPKTLKDNLKTLSELLGISSNDVTNTILKNPTMIGRKPESLKENIETSASLLGITKSDFIKMALKQVMLFTQKPETLSKNIETSASLLGIPKSDFIKVGTKTPELLYRNPETLYSNAEQSAKLLGISVEVFTRIALKQPQLFYLKPETLNKNTETSAKLFNISKTEFVTAALKQPQLFYRNPNSLNENIENLLNLFNITKFTCINLALKQPQLFYLKPETLNENVENSAKILNLSKKDFINAALKQPQLFYLKPETLNKNIESTATALSITKSELLQSALKQPTIFYLKADTLAKKSKIIEYFKKLKNESGNIKISSFYNKSEDKLYMDILIHLFYIQKYSAKLPKTQIEKNISNIMGATQNPMIFTIPEGNMAENFIKFAQDYSIKTAGKNVFKFIIKSKA